MKKRIFNFLFLGIASFFLGSLDLKAQATSDAKIQAQMERDKLPKPYNPEDNAEKKIADLVKKAQKERKNIILQAGGNWCIWCLRFNQYLIENEELKKIVEDNYFYYHLNYSKENKNEKLFKKYGDPGKFGYPVFLVLDSNGKLIHTQSSGDFEDPNNKKSYDYQKVKNFLESWVVKK